MRRILLTIQYEGTNYVGWQRQINGISVQEKLEEVLRVCEGKAIPIIGASRTDSGVHALAQHAHFDTDSKIPTEKYPFVFNSSLPSDISVSCAREVEKNFSARFDAKGKEYVYRIDNARHANALKSRYFAHVALELNEDLMNKAAKRLIGTKDFEAFKAAGAESKTSIRTIDRAEVKREGTDIIFTVHGNAFLYNMVRIMAGTLIQIGLKKLDIDAFDRAFETKNRLELGLTAPAKGLMLNKMDYDFGGNDE